MVGSLFKRAWGSQLLRSNTIFFIGTMSIAFFNYLYYPFLGRLLDLGSFGEVQVLISLFLQATIFLGAMSIVVVNVAANYPDKQVRGKIILELEKLTLYIMLAAALVAVLLVHQLQAFLKFGSIYPFLSLIVAVLVGVPFMLRNAYLQGVQDFASVSIGGVTAALGKLVFSVLLVLLGWRSFGAITGIIFGQLIALTYVARQARRRGFQHPLFSLRKAGLDLTSIKPELRYGSLVLVVSFISTFLFSGDIIVVKHYFSAVQAGAYAGIAAIARIIFFATGSVAGVLLSSVKLGRDRENHQLLWRSVVLMLAIGGTAALIFALAPNLVIGLLMGSRYTAYAVLLPQLGLAILLVSLVNLLFYYYLALRQEFMAFIALLGALVIGGLMVSNHATFWAVIHNLIYGSLGILVMLIAWGLVYERRSVS